MRVRRQFVTDLMVLACETRWKRSHTSFRALDRAWAVGCDIAEALELGDAATIAAETDAAVDAHVEANGTDVNLGYKKVRLVPSGRYYRGTVGVFVHSVGHPTVCERLGWTPSFARMPLTRAAVDIAAELHRERMSGPGRLADRFHVAGIAADLIGICGYGNNFGSPFEQLASADPYTAITALEDETMDGLFAARYPDLARDLLEPCDTCGSTTVYVPFNDGHPEDDLICKDCVARSGARPGRRN